MVNKLRIPFFSHSLPYDWKTPFGYMVTCLFMYATLFSAILCITPVLCLSCGSFWLLDSSIDAISNDLNEFNESNGKNIKNENDRKSLNELFYIILQDFSELKQLRSDFLSDKNHNLL